MSTLGLEKFSEVDNADGIDCIPKGGNASNPTIPQLNTTDILTDLDFLFQFKGTLNAYTGTLNLSPWFPYNIIGNLKVPFQSNAVAATNMPGEKLWLMDVLRKANRKFMAPVLLGDQKPVLTTGYTPETQLGSSGSYAVAPSTAETYKYRLRIPVSLYFDRFYDTDQKGNPGAIDDTYVSPLFMSSIGRNITPTLQLNPLFGTRYDESPFVQTGTLTTAPTWTDNGSTLTIFRNGFREPTTPNSLPPAFNWAYHTDIDEVAFAGTGKASFTFPLNGQLLSVTCWMFDPTLNSNAGGPIPIANIAHATLQYGAGIAKYKDVPITVQNRMLDQHGILGPEGVFFWDLYADTRSNVDAINTYKTSAVKLNIDLGTNVPGAGSYVHVVSEWLTMVG